MTDDVDFDFVWRRATPGDAPAVNRLLAVFGRQLGEHDLVMHAPPTFHREVWMTENGTAMFVLYFTRDTGRWTGHFTSLAVHPDHQGRGLGAEAVGMAMNVARRFAMSQGERMRVFGYSSPKRPATEHMLAKAGWKKLSASIGGGTALWGLDV